jgi:hypothetical protein
LNLSHPIFMRWQSENSADFRNPLRGVKIDHTPVLPTGHSSYSPKTKISSKSKSFDNRQKRIPFCFKMISAVMMASILYRMNTTRLNA